MSRQYAALAVGAVLLLSGFVVSCGSSETLFGVAQATVKICPGEEAQSKTLVALFDAREGDVIEFCEGTFDFTTGLLINSKRGLTLKGAGKDKTKLVFKTSDSAEGINVSHGDGITVQGLTVEDTPGNAIRIFKSSFVTLRDVGAGWSDRDPVMAGHQISSENGAYALYPVQSRHVLIEDSYAYGSSDAGVYVGQTSDVIVRRNLAKYNVAGYEFENTYRAVFEDNVATENTGGFLVFDLPDLAQYGEKNIVRNNKSFNNNLDNFAPVGNIVGVVPRGTGMLILSTDQLEIYGNEIYDNNTLGLAIVNFGLVDKNYPDLKYDHFPEGIHLHDNVFRDNGGQPQEPNPDRGEASALPAILVAKNGGKGAHIIWDGGIDAPNNCTAFPTDKDGIALNQVNPGETGRVEARVDERGRPNFQRSDNASECAGATNIEKKYNAWKFDAGQSQPRRPENWICIEESNSFSSTRPETSQVSPFLNANFPTAAQEDIPGHLATPASNDLTPHRCSLPARAVPALQLPFTPNPNSGDARPSESDVEAACNGGPPDQVNFAALLRYNCPRLDQYRLFTNPEDPRTSPTGGVRGVPFELNSALFSDYALKYRFLFMPPGQSAQYLDHTSPNPTAGEKVHESDGASNTFVFPLGTVIAKTFAFRVDDAAGNTVSENVVETRLLIKRQNSSGTPVWVGLPYVWTTQGGLRIAELKIAGDSAAVEYDYLDPDPDVKDGAVRKRYTGAVARYGIPAAMTCITCHGGDDREQGAPPIGLKARFLNRTNPALGGANQLTYLKDQGLLTGLPADLNTVEKAPRWNVPGDSGEAANSNLDIHQRVRAYMEVNCAHCHNPNGGGSNSGLSLDAFRGVGLDYGICKKPVAAGRGSGGHLHDIVPGPSSAEPGAQGADASILYYRLSSAETGVRMPPVARTVVHGDAANLIATWIDVALPGLIQSDNADADTSNDVVHDEEGCTVSSSP